MRNTVIPNYILDQMSTHYQAHLERISDYLAPGPGVWWRRTSEGVEFLDGEQEVSSRLAGPHLTHYRSKTTSDIELYLFQHWESLCMAQTELPAKHIRQYDANGYLARISTE